MRKFVCYDCKHKWELFHGTGRSAKCPNCGSTNIHRDPQDRGYTRKGGRGRGGGRRGQGRP